MKNTHGKGSHSLLYVLECEDKKYLKIGICKNEDQLTKRLSSLQTGNPKPINVLHYEERLSAKDAELYLHRVFSQYRTVGEWFEGITLDRIRSYLMMYHEQI